MANFLNDLVLKPGDKQFGIHPVFILGVLFFIVVVVFLTVASGGQLTLPDILRFVVLLSPLWLPLGLLALLWHHWIEWRQVKKNIETEYIMLEIVLSEEITRTPLAMETVLNVLYHTGDPQDWYEAYVKGATRPQFSLEIASLEGRVHFYIRCQPKHRDMITAQIYSQYSTVEVHEVEDYAAKIQYDENTMDLFAVEQQLEKPDPYPIKTYVDWGLDKPGLKEEEKIDPINSIIEFMGSLGKGEYCFMQIVVRSHVPDKQMGERGREDWQKVAEKEVQGIIEKLKSTAGDYVVYRPPHEGEKERMEAMMRNVRKKPFDTGIRILYFGYKDHGFNGDRRSAIPTAFRSFQSHTLNNFKPSFPTMFNWWLTNPFGVVAKSRKRLMFQAYRWRSFFMPPYERPYFVLSSEELATVYHFPSRATGTPTLERTPSRKSEGPSNLPT